MDYFKELVDQMYDQETIDYIEKELNQLNCQYEKEFPELSEDPFFNYDNIGRELSSEEIKKIVEGV